MRLSEITAKPKALKPSEIEVLTRIIKGDRQFSGRLLMAGVHMLVARGYITADLKTHRYERTKKYEFGRYRRVVPQVEAYAVVQAPRIEAAIERHGETAVLASLTRPPKAGA